MEIWKKKIRGYQSPWYRVCTKAICISKGRYEFGEDKIAFPFSVHKRTGRYGCAKYTRFLVALYTASNRNIAKFGATNSYGTVFALR